MNIIRELRKKAGIGQKELADIIGVSIPTVSEDRSARERLKVENGLIQGQKQGQENEPAAEMIEK